MVKYLCFKVVFDDSGENQGSVASVRAEQSQRQQTLMCMSRSTGIVIEVIVVLFTTAEKARLGGMQVHMLSNSHGHLYVLCDESLVLCHPYLEQHSSVHPHHPACTQQNGESFPIGAAPSGSFFASCSRDQMFAF